MLTGILAQVIGVDASSVEELMQRADEAVIEDKVQVCNQTLRVAEYDTPVLAL